jgi:hypothetical protein
VEPRKPRRRSNARDLRVQGELPERGGCYPSEREILLPHMERLLAELLEELEEDDGQSSTKTE